MPREHAAVRSYLLPPPLGLLVEDVQLARGDVATAAETLDRLAALAAGSKDHRTRAVARLAKGTVRAARGDDACAGGFPVPWSCSPAPSALGKLAQARAALARALGSAPAGSRSRGGATRARDVRERLVAPRRCRRECRLASTRILAELRRGRSRRDSGRLPNARARSYRCWPKAARTPTSVMLLYINRRLHRPRRRHLIVELGLLTEPRRPPTRCASRSGNPVTEEVFPPMPRRRLPRPRTRDVPGAPARVGRQPGAGAASAPRRVRALPKADARRGRYGQQDKERFIGHRDRSRTRRGAGRPARSLCTGHACVRRVRRSQGETQVLELGAASRYCSCTAAGTAPSNGCRSFRR